MQIEVHLDISPRRVHAALVSAIRRSCRPTVRRIDYALAAEAEPVEITLLALSARSRGTLHLWSNTMTDARCSFSQFALQFSALLSLALIFTNVRSRGARGESQADEVHRQR